MGFQDFIPLILIFAIMYFLLIRPQQKKVKEHQNMVTALRRGDQVVTQGGLIGKVTKVKEDNEIEVVAGVNLPMLIKMVSDRKKIKLNELVKISQDSGRKYINVASNFFKEKKN